MRPNEPVTRNRWNFTPVILITWFLLMAPCAWSQFIRPLATEPVDTLPSRTAELRTGMQVQDSFRSPVDDREGALFRGPTVGLRLGLSSAVEMQVLGPLYQHFSPAGSDDSSNAVGSFSIHTKVKILNPRARRPGIAFRWGTKLPNVSENTGIDTDKTDFFSECIFELDRNRFNIWGSAGLWILGDSGPNASQDDLLSLGLAVRYPLRYGDVLGEIRSTIGSRRQDRSSVRIGTVFRFRPRLRVDVVAGSEFISDESPSWEIGGGVTLEFTLFGKSSNL